MVGLRRHHRDAIVETSIGDEIVNLGGMIIALDPARAPDDQHAGRGSRSRDNASTATSTPFNGWMRPTKSSTGSSPRPRA